MRRGAPRRRNPPVTDAGQWTSSGQEFRVTCRAALVPIHQRLHLVLCDTHAPVFRDSEPPSRLAHTPLAKSSRATLTTSTCVIGKLHVGLTMCLQPKCSLRSGHACERLLLGRRPTRHCVSLIDF